MSEGNFANVAGVIDKRTFRREASRKAQIANKRIQRLERAGLRNSPAYRKYVEEGGAKFGVKGKTFNEVQSEMARLNRFLDAKTSTIRGINTTLKELAANTGMKYKNLADLRSKADTFFELSSKVEQYYRTAEDIASAIGYQKIWEAINVYVQDAEIDLGDAEVDIEQMTQAVTALLTGIDRGNIIDNPFDKNRTIWTVIK